MNNSKEKINAKVKENYNLMATPLMSILPGQISFFVVLSIVPVLSIIMMLLSKLSLSFESVEAAISHYVPIAATDIIFSIIAEQKADVVDFLFIISAFYIASKATHSIIVASTQIYNGKQKDFFRTRIKAIIMLLILIFLIVLGIIVLMLGGKFVAYLSSVSKVISPFATKLYYLIKWPFIFFVIFIVVKVIYTVAPNANVPSKSVNKGALLTTIIWGISTYAYSFYVVNIANYSRFYGNISNIIILMIWIYWLCYIFVYGMTLNEYKLKSKEEYNYESL